MSDWKDLYPLVSSSGVTPTAPIENPLPYLSLRDEFNSFVVGGSGDPRVGIPLIIRRMRRDSSGAMTSCSCVDPVSLEPNRDYPCPYCLGRGYLWDEELAIGYKVVAASPGGSNAEVNLQKHPFGTSYLPASRFYFSSDVALTRDDRIVEIALDEEGLPLTPYQRVFVYETTLLRAFRGSSGRIEFWGVNCQVMGPETQGANG